MERIVFTFLIYLGSFEVNAQEIGEIREVNLILSDIPFSGEDYQPNFINSDTSEIISFGHTTWIDKHVSLYDFFHDYRDSCLYNTLYFSITMIYLPMEVYNYKRYEGYFPTGEIINTWVLTSILKEDEESD